MCIYYTHNVIILYDQFHFFYNTYNRTRIKVSDPIRLETYKKFVFLFSYLLFSVNL